MGNLINAVNQLSYPAKCVHASWTVELSKLKAKIGIVQKIIISYGDWESNCVWLAAKWS
ncbi:hypothetical protein HanIR_Chr17g0873771 [Helianthus annuus]|nr:hypothetical protein HanIR_Chr17g0873771 [Helianthus annuus]KAJ0447717.1 hypothetical protein HanHA89_Chr17g0708511 [Helianthus annuus]KAJ0632616.1 hypothetical protein HanLR1_Chr17g0667131 [Helianthus annuus]